MACIAEKFVYFLRMNSKYFQCCDIVHHIFKVSLDWDMFRDTLELSILDVCNRL